jgi:hypothetical protein
LDLRDGWRLPFLRHGHSAIHDTANNRAIVFGGWNGRDFFNSVWALDLTSGSEAWTKIDPAGPHPPARGQHSAIYDAAEGRMIVFGGRSRVKLFSDVWALDLTPGAEAWTQLSPAGTPPIARRWHSAVYDTANGRMVVFGGGGGGAVLSDVWALDLTSGAEAWSQLAEGSPGPPARVQHSAIYDAAMGFMILFGGYDAGTLFNDVWALNLTTETWVQLSPSGTPPTVRRGHTAVYDGANSRLLLFGGVGSGGFHNDLWELSLVPGSVAWTQLAPSGTAPAGRAWHTGMVDMLSGRFITIGGHVMIGDIKGEMQWSLALDDLTWATFEPDLPGWWQPWPGRQGGQIQSTGKPSVRLEIEDALPETTVNLLRGSEAWFVVKIKTSSETYSHAVDVFLQVDPDKLEVVEVGTRYRDAHEVENWIAPVDLGDGVYMINNVELEDRSGSSDYSMQIVFKANVLASAPAGPVDTLSARAYGLNWQYTLEDNAYAVIVNDPPAWVITNRTLLFEEFDNGEVRDLLDEIFEQAQGSGFNENPTAVVLYADRYVPAIRNWNNLNVDYSSEDAANDAASDLDVWLDSWADYPTHLLIVGDDNIVPFYRKYDQVNRENCCTDICNGDPVITELVSNNYFFTDNPYGDVAGGIDWEEGDLEIAVGRIVGARAKGMRVFLENSVQGPNTVSDRVIIASGDNWNWDLPASEKDVVDTFDLMNYNYNAALIDGDPTKRAITDEMEKGFVSVSLGGHGDPCSWKSPGGPGPGWSSARIKADEMELYPIGDFITTTRAFFQFGACRVGMSHSRGDAYDSMIYALVRHGASGGVAAGGKTCCSYPDNWPGATSYGERLHNKFWAAASLSPQRTDPLGWALMKAKDTYSPDAGWTPQDTKSVQVPLFFGVPWMKLQGNVVTSVVPALPSPENAAWSVPQRAAPQQTYAVTATVDASLYAISQTVEGYDLILVEGMRSTFNAPDPALPIASLELLLPLSATVTGLAFTPSQAVALSDLDIPTFQFEVGDTAITATYTTTVDGIYPITATFDASALDTYQLVNINVIPVTYDAANDQATLYQRVDVEVQYDTPRTVALTSFETDRLQYVPGDTISTTSRLVNAGDMTETVTAMLVIVDNRGQFVGFASPGDFDIPAGGSYDLSLGWTGALEGDAYVARLLVWDDGEIVAGVGREVFVTAGELSEVIVPDLLWLEQTGHFTVTFDNHSANTTIAMASLVIYDEDDTLVAWLEPEGAIVDGGASHAWTFSWTPDQPGDYVASAIIMAGGQEYGPVSKPFVIGYPIYLPLVSKAGQ